MNTLFSIIIIALFTCFPLVIWGYGSLYLSSNVWNRARFIFGMGAGAIAVIMIALFDGVLRGDTVSSVVGFSLLILLLSILTWVMTLQGSVFIRTFLTRVIGLHALLFILLFGFSALIERSMSDISILPITLMSLAGFLITASIEESVKHLSSIGLTSREFRFTRRDFLLFTFFVTLGFVTFENAIYMMKALEFGDLSNLLITGLSRILLALPLHVFAASICVMMWWRALSYRFISWQYISLFSLGYLLAISVHGVYNALLSYGLIVPVLMIVGVGYIAFTQWIIDER